MILTSILVVDKTPTLSLHNNMVKLDFGHALLEIDIEGFKDLIASLIFQAAYQGINLTTK
jgi:hypothetical protein